MQSLGKLLFVLNKASNDFQVPYSKFHKGCATHIIYSSKLNQIIALKIPARKHYISKELAQNYLQSTRKLLIKELGESTVKRAYILNILISNKLTKSCYELVSDKDIDKNFDMVFIPKKPSDEDDILFAIFKSLSTKCKSWTAFIKKGCEDKGVSPFSDIRNKIKDIEKAYDIFYFESLRLKKVNKK